MGLDRPGGAQAGLTQLQQGADRLAGGSQQVAGGVDQLVDQIKLMADGLDEASAFLLTMKEQRRGSVAWPGSTSRPEVLQLAEFKKAAKAFISPDGHSVRYLVQTKLNPFSSEAMDQVNADQRRRPRRPAEHHAVRRHDLDGRISRRRCGTPATTTSTTSGSSSSRPSSSCC